MGSIQTSVPGEMGEDSGSLLSVSVGPCLKEHHLVTQSTLVTRWVTPSYQHCKTVSRQILAIVETGECSDRIPKPHVGWLRDTSRGSWHVVQSFQGEAKILTSHWKVKEYGL